MWTACTSTTHRHHEREPALQRYLSEARALLADPPATPEADADGPRGEAFERLRWFWLPEELAADR